METDLRTALIAAAHRAGESHRGLIFWDDVLVDPGVVAAIDAMLAAERARIHAAVEGVPMSDHYSIPSYRAAVLAEIGAER